MGARARPWRRWRSDGGPDPGRGGGMGARGPAGAEAGGGMGGPPAREAGQASLEVLALLPLFVGVALIAMQVAGMLASEGVAQDNARARAMAATGTPGSVVTVTGTAPWPVPGALGMGPGRARIRVAVRLP